jgi:hypothetical protein
MSAFDDATKLACVEREIQMRYGVYPSRVRQGLMPKAMADREIAIMQAIAQDYREKVRGPGLFDSAPQKDKSDGKY